MTRPEPLVLTDASGDTLEAYATPGGSLGVTVEEDERATVLLDRSRARDLFRWLAAYLGEHALVALPDHLGYVRCARCTVLFDPVTGHHCAATDDEQVRAWVKREQPLPPAVSKTAITGDAADANVLPGGAS